MLIDIHVHTRIYDTPERGGLGKGKRATPEELKQMLVPKGVRAACVLPGISPECSWFQQSNEEILIAAEQHPDFIIPFMGIDPRNGNNSPSADLGYLMDH